MRIRRPGPVCRTYYEEEFTFNGFEGPGVIRIIYAPIPTPSISKEDEAEFKLLKSKVKIKKADASDFQSAFDYVDYRNEYFGSEAAYSKFAAESDKELEETKWNKKGTWGLKNVVEFTGEAQKVFYRWVRKAYIKKRGDDTDVPAIIRAQMAPELVEALKKVKDAYKKDFKAGGFNPRPVKYNGFYRLGTLSDHAVGTAADIDDKTNPQLTIPQWAFIEKLTGKKVDRRASRWENNPQALWKDIRDISDLFVKAVAARVKEIETERAAKKAALATLTSAAAVSGPPSTGFPAAAVMAAAKTAERDPLDVVFEGQPALKTYKAGFFTLEWELVEQLHAFDFLWGATFPDNVDLHHFQL
jgi:hypothetical protein